MSGVLKVKTDIQAKRYEKVVYDFLSEGGALVVCSDDESFVRAVRFTVSQLKLDVRNFCRETVDYDEVVTLANKALEKPGSMLVVFLERRLHKSSCIKSVKVLKSFYPDKAKVIVVSNEVAREEIILTHEIGADSFITKPISANALIEKIAFVLRPNSQLGVLMDRCAALIEEGDLAQAEQIAAKVFELKPESTKAHLLMGDIHRRAGDHKASEKHYLAAAKSEKLYIEPLKKLVDLSTESGNLEKKLFFLHKLDKLSPLNFERKVEIGETYLEKDDNEKAREYFEEAKKVVGKVANDMVSESLMEIARKIGERDQELALSYMNEAIEVKGASLGKADLWMFNNRGILLRRQGKWREAVDNYERALSIAPNDAGLYYNIGVAYADGRVYDRALENFDKAVTVDPAILKHTPAVPYNIATAHHRCRNKAEALSFAKQALELDPDYEPAKRLLAQLA